MILFDTHDTTVMTCSAYDESCIRQETLCLKQLASVTVCNSFVCCMLEYSSIDMVWTLARRCELAAANNAHRCSDCAGVKHGVQGAGEGVHCGLR